MRRRKQRPEPGPLPPVGPTTYAEVKRDILRAVEELDKMDPGAAKYLREHLVMDDEKQTFMYTGDDRLKMDRLMAHLEAEGVRARQPQVGDVCLHCGHGGAATFHWFWLGESEFTRPDGTTGQAKWLIVCGECFGKADGDPRRVTVAGELVWQSNEPIIGEPS